MRKNFKHKIYECDLQEIEKKALSPVDIICGGFPCQPFSKAGKGKGSKDSRFVWDEIIEVVRATKPKYLLWENVFNLTHMENGKTLQKICTSLECEGYEVECFGVPAGSLQASHERDRIWILAYPNKVIKVKDEESNKKSHGGKAVDDKRWRGWNGQAIHHTGCLGLSFSKIKKMFPWWESHIQGIGITEDKRGLFARIGHGSKAQDIPFLSGDNDGFPSWMDTHSNQRRGAIGNALQPQVAAVFLHAIKVHHNEFQSI